MERIQAAIQKAKERRGDAPAPGPQPPLGPGGLRASRAAARPAVGPAWAGLARFEPDPQLMTRNRIVTFADTDPMHTTFDMMRTKLLRAMRSNGWTSIGITSPSSDCGKTTLAANLAFSLAHQPEVRTVLVDLDLRRPMLAKTLGHHRAAVDGLGAAGHPAGGGELRALRRDAGDRHQRRRGALPGRAAAQLRRPPAGSRR